jgi:cell wall-associated NlpC family hydrolase
MKAFLKPLLAAPLLALLALPAPAQAQSSILNRVGTSSGSFTPGRLQAVSSGRPSTISRVTGTPDAPAPPTSSYRPERSERTTAIAIAGSRPAAELTIEETEEGTTILSTGRGPQVSSSRDKLRAADVAMASELSASGLNLVQRTLRTAKNYMGVKYLWGGTTPKGFDCSGFVQYVFDKHNVKVPRTSREQALAGRPVPARLDALRPGDLMIFASNGKYIDHVGIYAGDKKMLHSSSSGGGVEYLDLTSPRARWYLNHMVKARRIVH